MSGEDLILRFTEFNGGPATKDGLKNYHAQVQKYVDSIGTGPFVPKLSEIAKRVTNAINQMTDAGFDEVDKIELLPFETDKPKANKDSVEIKKALGELTKMVKARRKTKVIRKTVYKESPEQKKKIAKVISEFEKGKLTTHGRKVKKESQAKAIALREAGVPKKVTKKKSKKVAGLKGVGENKSLQPSKKTQDAPPVAVLPPAEPKPDLNNLGFITADKKPETASDIFRFAGPMGDLLGDLQHFKNELVIAGETHSSKSQLGMQIADAYASLGNDVAWIDWEQGGLQSKDTQNLIDRNVKPENKKKIHVTGDLPRTLDAVKELAKKFKVIALDSGTKLKQVTNAWIDELREQYPNTDWIIMMQQNEKGGTRGGSAAEFDAPVVLKTYRPDHTTHEKNYAVVFKNRGNKTGLFYSINEKKIIPDPNKPEEKPKPIVQPQPIAA